MTRIEGFASRQQAELARGLLVSHGFDARLSADDAGGAYPNIAYAIGGTAIVVPDDQFEDAVALLDEHADHLVPADGRSQEVDQAGLDDPLAGGPEPIAARGRRRVGRLIAFLLSAVFVALVVADRLELFPR